MLGGPGDSPPADEPRTPVRSAPASGREAGEEKPPQGAGGEAPPPRFGLRSSRPSSRARGLYTEFHVAPPAERPTASRGARPRTARERLTAAVRRAITNLRRCVRRGRRQHKTSAVFPPTPLMGVMSMQEERTRGETRDWGSAHGQRSAAAAARILQGRSRSRTSSSASDVSAGSTSDGHASSPSSRIVSPSLDPSFFGLPGLGPGSGPSGSGSGSGSGLGSASGYGAGVGSSPVAVRSWDSPDRPAEPRRGEEETEVRDEPLVAPMSVALRSPRASPTPELTVFPPS